MKTILFATGSVEFENDILKSLNRKSRGEYTMVDSCVHKDSVLAKVKQRMPNILVLSEGLPPEGKDLVQLVRDVRVADNDIKVILCFSKDHPVGDPMVASLITLSVYDFVPVESTTVTNVVNLIERPRTYADVEKYTKVKTGYSEQESTSKGHDFASTKRRYNESDYDLSGASGKGGEVLEDINSVAKEPVSKKKIQFRNSLSTKPLGKISLSEKKKATPIVEAKAQNSSIVVKEKEVPKVPAYLDFSTEEINDMRQGFHSENIPTVPTINVENTKKIEKKSLDEEEIVEETKAEDKKDSEIHKEEPTDINENEMFTTPEKVKSSSFLNKVKPLEKKKEIPEKLSLDNVEKSENKRDQKKETQKVLNKQGEEKEPPRRIKPVPEEKKFELGKIVLVLRGYITSSQTALHIAMKYAKERKRVLLIDAEKNSSLSRFENMKFQGLTYKRSTRKTAVDTIDTDNFDLVIIDCAAGNDISKIIEACDSIILSLPQDDYQINTFNERYHSVFEKKPYICVLENMAKGGPSAARTTKILECTTTAVFDTAAEIFNKYMNGSIKWSPSIVQSYGDLFELITLKKKTSEVKVNE